MPSQEKLRQFDYFSASYEGTVTSALLSLLLDECELCAELDHSA